MCQTKRRMQAWLLGAVLLGVVGDGSTGRVGAQERGGLFTAPPLAAEPGGQARSRGLGEIRSREVGIDVRRLPSVVTAGREERLVLEIFEDVELAVQIDRIETKGHARIFIGHVDGLAGQAARTGDNSVTLVVADGVMIGSINTPTAHYQVRFDGRSHIVREVDPGAFPDEIDPTPSAVLGAAVDDKTVPGRAAAPPSGPEALAMDAAVPADPGGDVPLGARTDVMILYTASARAAAGGTTAIQNLITLGITETNAAYANSGIGTRLRLVHIREVAYTESGDAQTDRNRLFNGADGHLDEAHTWRNAYGADMVQMLVDNAGGGCGIAYLNGPAASMAGQSAYAYAVTDWQCVSPNYTFAHEFGHIQGANHAPDDPTGTGAYSYSFGFKRCNATPYFRSVMAYACNIGQRGTPRSLHFSNPAVNFSGAPTGVATQDNGLTLHNTRTIVAAFRDEQYLVRVTSLLPVADALPGETRRLGALVTNDGPYPLPATAAVWFAADGPGTGPGEGWAGSTALTGLGPGESAWYYYDFTIPATAATGAWSYQARVWDSGAEEYLSDWQGPSSFAVLTLEGLILGLQAVPVSTAGSSATLSGQVQNTGTAAFPNGTALWFYVTGPNGVSEFVGSTAVSGLAPGATSWYSYNWPIPGTSRAGRYAYWAILRHNSDYISPWSASQEFTVRPAKGQ